ncbi:hypothetical protein F1C76_06765 [Geodermatophilaceae bacterium NBWT11]|nr:hypothetical protein F1C76_06765 [Geodermatophilaceae bacterium NBWT11]
MTQPGKPPPLMETRKVLQAARPPVGEGPPTREVLAGLRRRRPPAAVLLAVALMALVPLVLLVLALLVLVDTWTGDDGVFLSLVKTVLFSGTLFLLSALAWRGVKRALHFGSYREGLFVARLTTGVCVVIAVFLLAYVVSEGNEQEPSMLVPFVVLAVVWLPALPLQTRSAREWPDRVLLRSGPQVRGERELAFLLEARPHSCGQPLPVGAAIAVADEESRGWVWRGDCPHCGRPAVHVFGERTEDAPTEPWAWGRDGSRPGLGGGDLLHLGDRFEQPADVEPTALADDQLHQTWLAALGSVQATEQLLQLVRPGKDAVAPWRRTGRPVPLTTPGEVFSRTAIESRLAARRDTLARLEAETARRRALPA